MKGRDRLLFNLLTFVLVVVLILVGIRTREADKQIKMWELDIKRRAERGVQDPQLRETVDRMEAELRARLEESFDLEEDPLDLTRVIKTRKFLRSLGLSEMAESDRRLRLAATVETPSGDNSAIIQFRGRSHMLRAGDEISGYRVAAVGNNTITLRRGEERLVLRIEKAPDTQAAEEVRMATMRMPEVSVRQVPVEDKK